MSALRRRVDRESAGLPWEGSLWTGPPATAIGSANVPEGWRPQASEVAESLEAHADLIGAFTAPRRMRP